MEDDTKGTSRQIDATEANRLAQEFDRQVHSDLPEYTGDNPQADPDRMTERVASADRESPLTDLGPGTYPPPSGRETVIGGSPEEREALAEEERP